MWLYLQLRTASAVADLTEADKNQTIAVLEARVAELEIRNEELITVQVMRETEVGGNRVLLTPPTLAARPNCC